MRLEIKIFGVTILDIGKDPEAPDRIALLACAKYHDGFAQGLRVPVSDEEEEGVSEWAKAEEEKHLKWAEELRKAAHYVF